MLRINSISPNANSTALPDLLASHRREELIKCQKSSEEEINKIHNRIHSETKKPFITMPEQTPLAQLKEFNRYFEERKAEGLRDLTYLREKSDELVVTIRELTKIQTVTPEKILKYIRSSPAYKSMHGSKKIEFMAIEEALSDTSIITAMPSQVILYQLGVLGKAYQNENKFISPLLFHNLMLMRVQQAPDFLKTIEINGALYKSSLLEMCQLADEYLCNNTSYQDSKKRFNQRLQGVKVEILQQCFEKFAERNFNELPDRIENFVYDEKILNMSYEEAMDHLSKLETLTKPIETHEMQVQKANACYYVLEDEARKIMQLLIPEHKRNQIVIDETIGGDLWKIMQASLSTSIKLSEEKKLKSDHCFIASLSKIADETSHKCQKKMQSQYTTSYEYVVSDAKDDLKRLVKDHEKSEKQSKDCRLQGEALITAYFEKVENWLDNNLKKKREKIKQKCRESSLFGTVTSWEIASKLKKERLEFQVHQDAMENLKKFALEHKDRPIIVYKQLSKEAVDELQAEREKTTQTNSSQDNFRVQVASIQLKSPASFYLPIPTEKNKDKSTKQILVRADSLIK